MISDRIKPTLPSVVSEDQTGFQKGRLIISNIRLTVYIFSFSEMVTKGIKELKELRGNFPERRVKLRNCGASRKYESSSYFVHR